MLLLLSNLIGQFPMPLACAKLWTLYTCTRVTVFDPGGMTAWGRDYVFATFHIPNSVDDEKLEEIIQLRTQTLKFTHIAIFSVI